MVIERLRSTTGLHRRDEKLKKQIGELKNIKSAYKGNTVEMEAQGHIVKKYLERRRIRKEVARRKSK